MLLKSLLIPSFMNSFHHSTLLSFLLLTFKLSELSHKTFAFCGLCKLILEQRFDQGLELDSVNLLH